ncbi:MAG: hypothetical protein GXO69_03240 [Acidobacteria bacterium]|nr:hypothetical protein [Acidobacteriota bacterium]
MLNTGVCGALCPEYQIGEVVLPAIVRLWGGNDEIVLMSGGFGKLITVSVPVLSPDEKQMISGDFVDMECFYQAQWAINNAIPFHCMKVVSDSPRTDADSVAHLAHIAVVLPILTKSVENFAKKILKDGSL